MGKRALIVGYDPDTIDFDSAFFRGAPVTAASIRAGLAADRARIEAAGHAMDVLWVPYHGDPATEAARLAAALADQPADVVVLGAGIRLNPQATLLFEALVNAAADARVRLGFNSRPTDTAEAIARA